MKKTKKKSDLWLGKFAFSRTLKIAFSSKESAISKAFEIEWSKFCDHYVGKGGVMLEVEPCKIGDTAIELRRSQGNKIKVTEESIKAFRSAIGIDLPAKTKPWQSKYEFVEDTLGVKHNNKNYFQLWNKIQNHYYDEQGNSKDVEPLEIEGAKIPFQLMINRGQRAYYIKATKNVTEAVKKHIKVLPKKIKPWQSISEFAVASLKVSPKETSYKKLWNKVHNHYYDEEGKKIENIKPLKIGSSFIHYQEMISGKKNAFFIKATKEATSSMKTELSKIRYPKKQLPWQSYIEFSRVSLGVNEKNYAFNKFWTEVYSYYYTNVGIKRPNREPLVIDGVQIEFQFMRSGTNIIPAIKATRSVVEKSKSYIQSIVEKPKAFRRRSKGKTAQMPRMQPVYTFSDIIEGFNNKIKVDNHEILEINSDDTDVKKLWLAVKKHHDENKEIFIRGVNIEFPKSGRSQRNSLFGVSKESAVVLINELIRIKAQEARKTLSVIEEKYDQLGKAYYTAQDAKKIFQYIKADERIPLKAIEVGCVSRKELMIANMLEMGVRPEAIGRVLNHMKKSNQPWKREINGPYRSVGFILETVDYRANISKDTSWRDHLAPTLRVQDEVSGKILNLVIDPAIYPKGPITIKQWRREQGYPNSIIMFGRLGENQMQVVTKYLNEKQIKEAADMLEQTTNKISIKTDHYEIISSETKKLSEDQKISFNEKLIKKFVQEFLDEGRFSGEYLIGKRDVISSPTDKLPDWNKLEKGSKEYNQRLENALNILAPIREHEKSSGSTKEIKR